MATMKEVADGLAILAKYDAQHIAAEHDVIYAGPSDPERISAEDRKALLKLGWHIDSESESWARFV